VSAGELLRRTVRVDVRTELTDRMPIFGERHLGRTLAAYSAQQDGLRGEVPLLRAFSAQPSSEPSGHLSMHWALQ
jgi:hypothetical protein